MGACDCDCYENLMGKLYGEKKEYIKNTKPQVKTSILIKNFDCNICMKENVCKYKEIETPEIISKVENKIDNECCPPVIKFTISCEEFQKDFLTIRNNNEK